MSNSVMSPVETVNSLRQEKNDAYEQLFRFATDINILLDNPKTTANSYDNKPDTNRYIFHSEYFNYPKSTTRIYCEILIALCFIAIGMYASVI